MVHLVLIVQTLLEAGIIILAYVAALFTGYFVWGKLEAYYWKRKDKKHLQQWQKNHELRLQEECRRRLHKKEREKYPLFFWKESVNGTIDWREE